ncbi:unnamed protein product [Arabis nemorensis]|uniref:NET domain-containing protein n=1 Tax=Arabis nemorensis TaxID=586526 RepID=A0A565BS89_9BRAS|nr:unnamed protein product [Arabis nemorensis]
MPKRVAEAPPSSETHKIRPDSFGNYRSQVSELLSQDERSLHHDQQSGERSLESPIGAGMSNDKKENMNVLLRQCVRNLTPEIDEMQQRVCSMYLISQLGNKSPSSSPSRLKSIGPEEFGGAIEDDIQLLLSSDPDLVKKITSQYSNVLLSKLEDMEQKVENLLDEVVTTCRPMTCGEKLDLQNSIKELPEKNLDRIAEIVRNHYISSGKDLSDVVIVNLNQLENVTLWRLHYYIAAVKSATDLAC